MTDTERLDFVLKHFKIVDDGLDEEYVRIGVYVDSTEIENILSKGIEKFDDDWRDVIDLAIERSKGNEESAKV